MKPVMYMLFIEIFSRSHSLFCPLAGQRQLLLFKVFNCFFKAFMNASHFSAKSNQKLPAAPFALKVAALAVLSLPQRPRPDLSIFKVPALARYYAHQTFLNKYFSFINRHVFRLVFLIILYFLTSCSDSKNNRQENQYPVILEIISVDTSESVTNRLRAFISNDDELYRWKTHYVIYNKSGDASVLSDSITSVFPQAEIKLYDNLYYNFNRKYCPDTSTAKEWDNIIFTANLVEDTVMQQEYMAYHQTQFEEWPEVPLGFCNASFQQLIMFRNGRQLMLVISIPKGENLDELNPKTTENNPRVDEWNRLMAKYQEGVPGTDEGEVWAFFRRYEK